MQKGPKVTMSFVSLHNHTEYSVLSSTIRVKSLFEQAKKLGQKAIAVTDHGTTAAAHEALLQSQATGVKLIMGSEVYFRHNPNDPAERFKHLVLLAANKEGYRNLLTLQAKGFDTIQQINKKAYSVLNYNLLQEHSEGLICLTSCGNGLLSQLLMRPRSEYDYYEELQENIDKLKSIFGDRLGFEIQAHSIKRFKNGAVAGYDQRFLNDQFIKLGKIHNVRVVPTCNTHYLTPEDHDAHDKLLCVASGQPYHSNFRNRYDQNELYLKTEDQIRQFFSRHYADRIDSFIENTQYFADMCEEPKWISPKYSNPSGKELPEFPVKDQKDYPEFLAWLDTQSEDVKKLKEDFQYYRFVCFKNLDKKEFQATREEIIERIWEELDVIEYRDFSSYMLVVADFLEYARSLSPFGTGYGRGSVGGCLTANLAGIHSVDPFKYGLIFARFQNKQKAAMPDIDSDIMPRLRDEVIAYLGRKYGADHVAHVSNWNRITPKVWARDICRALELGGSQKEAVKLGNTLAESIPISMHSVEQAYKESPLFAALCEQFPQLKKYFCLDGLIRASATHAGGILVSKRPLIGLVPYRKDKNGVPSIEYDKDVAEANGLVKIDILGLQTLQILEHTYEIALSNGKDPCTLKDFDPEVYDKQTYDLISKGDTFGVFQLGTSGGTIALCKGIEPSSIKDISDINALARPSCKDIRPGYIKAKREKKGIELLHPSMERSFGHTYGYGLYEESLLFLGLDVAGWDLNEADGLRKLTKEKGKNPEKIKKLRDKFIQDAKDRRGIDTAIATEVWDDVISNFSGYGFNFSHSALYSFTSYRTAYAKAHFTIEFLLANLLSELNGSAYNADDNVQKLKQEIRSNNIVILKPSIDESEYNYTIVSGNKILTGFSAMKSLQEKAISDIVAKRPFKSFFDFMVRVDSGLVQAGTIQALIGSGCFDHFGITRRSMYLCCQDYRKKLTSWLKRHNPDTETFDYPFPLEDWTLTEKYAIEQFYMGESFICSQPVAYGEFYNRKFGNIKISDYYSAPDRQKFYIRGILKELFIFPIKKEGSSMLGRKMAKGYFTDVTDTLFPVTIFPDVTEQILKMFGLEQDDPKDVQKKLKEYGFFFEGSVNIYNDEFGVVIENIFETFAPPAPPSDWKTKMMILRAKDTKGQATDVFVQPLASQDDIIDFLENGFAPDELTVNSEGEHQVDYGDFEFVDYEAEQENSATLVIVQ